MALTTLNTEKYKAAFLYMLQSLGGIEGKKKVCKLFYFLDFDYYEAYEEPFTGETYVSYRMGPFPKSFEEITEEMEKERLIQRTSEKKASWHEYETVKYIPSQDLVYSFTDQERKMLDRVVRKYGNLTGKELEDLTHAQAPYNAVDPSEEIPYEYAFYRETSDLLE